MRRSNPVPCTYAEWRHCITVECGLKLTVNFVEARLTALRNKADPHTRQFLACYGEAHRRQVIAWLEQALDEPLPAGP